VAGDPSPGRPGTGWTIKAIEPDRIQTGYHDDGAPAWLATLTRAR
jgi:hypothetical protein